jgi:hypothetical protein
MLVLMILAGALWFFAAAKTAPPPVALNIFFSGDTSGRLVPCGCFTGQMGGLTRLKTVLSNKSGTNDIKVDVGDAIAGSADYQAIQYDYMLRAFAGMGYDALNIGHREAQLSAAQLADIRKKSPVTLLSANLFDEASGQRIFDATKIIERGGKKIGIVGVLDAGCMSGELGRGLRVAPMETVLQEILPPLRKQTDAIVLLAFTDESGLDRLAQQFYEANLILGGKVSQPAQKLIKENRSYVLYTANESRAVGIVHASLDSHFNANDFQMLMLDASIPQDSEITKLAAQYRDQIRSARLNIDDSKQLEADEVPGIRNAARYVGTEACIGCHQTAANIWGQTAHSRAFASLVAKQADADPNCIACHTVGFGAVSGYKRQLQGSRLASVGCESCHGPGSLHVAQRKSGHDFSFKFRPLAAGDCKQCHHGEFSPPFDWDACWAKIKHGNEPRLSRN